MTRKQFLYLFLTPTLLILFFLAFYPLINALVISLQDWDIRYNRPPNFIGLDNYSEMFFEDPRFINSLKITLSWVMLTVGGTTLLAFVLSLIIHQYTQGQFRQFCLFIFTIPVMLPHIGAAYMWRLMYSPSIGVINYLLGLVGIGPIGFLSDPSIALLSVAAIDIWQWTFLIAALLVILLQEVPRETVEAAMIDGAKPVQLYRHIYFPIILPVSIPIFFIKLMESLRSFDYIFVMTAGGPGIATETLDMYAYWQGIGSSGRISYASAMSIFMLVITILIMNIIWRMTKKWY